MVTRTDNQDFQSFVVGLRSRALSGDIAPQVFDTALKNAAPMLDVLALQSKQSEFVLSLRGYLARVLPLVRIRKGRAIVRKKRLMFNHIESRFGVGTETVAAIWGVETDFGRQRGTFPVIPALATLAWRGRRAKFFENELLAALMILQEKQADLPEMRGSWAGAMGHGQFLPSSYRQYAVDCDEDGRADIWHDDPADGLASIAHYLKENGWHDGAPWGLEIDLPEGFDYGLSGMGQTFSLADWIAMGITLKSGDYPADYGPASILLPAGAAGPAFLVFGNFRVLLAYNNATLYALAVGSLADQIAGARPYPLNMWPDEAPLSQQEVSMLQATLTAQGFNAGAADGLMGPDTFTAIQGFQKARELPADGHASRALLKALQALA